MRNVLRMSVGLSIFILLSGLAFDKKPLYEIYWVSIIGAFTGASIGVIAGLCIGGVGIVCLGTGFGIPAAVILGVSGFAFGGFGGSFIDILRNPDHYTMNLPIMVVIVALALTAPLLIGKEK